MKKQWWTILVLGFGLAQAGLAYDCNTDCGREAAFKYPCPTLRNPGRKCEGRNEAKFVACSTEKTVACNLRDSIYHAYADRVKDMLKGRFNSHTYASAVQDHQQGSYLNECEGAGIVTCATIGAEIGGPWGAALSGSVGVFVSDRLCEQSETW